MIANDKNKCLQTNFDLNTEYTLLELILCIVLVSKEIEGCNLIQLLLYFLEWPH